MAFTSRATTSVRSKRQQFKSALHKKKSDMIIGDNTVDLHSCLIVMLVIHYVNAKEFVYRASKTAWDRTIQRDITRLRWTILPALASVLNGTICRGRICRSHFCCAFTCQSCLVFQWRHRLCFCDRWRSTSFVVMMMVMDVKMRMAMGVALGGAEATALMMADGMEVELVIVDVVVVVKVLRKPILRNWLLLLWFRVIKPFTIGIAIPIIPTLAWIFSDWALPRGPLRCGPPNTSALGSKLGSHRLVASQLSRALLYESQKTWQSQPKMFLHAKHIDPWKSLHTIGTASAKVSNISK